MATKKTPGQTGSKKQNKQQVVFPYFVISLNGLKAGPREIAKERIGCPEPYCTQALTEVGAVFNIAAFKTKASAEAAIKALSARGGSGIGVLIRVSEN
jgi:hypothetical protein